MNNKKTIIVLILILLVGIVGLTVAYFSNTTSINNLFSTNPYGTTVEEEFVSPDNWLPGDTTDKTITVTNSGSVDEAVRISYQEQWKAKDKTILSGLIDNDGNLTSNTENSEHAAIINFSDNNDWTQSNGYYYYNYRLAPGETTSSLIDSVTFNSKVKNSSNCVSSENNGTKTITCNSTQSGYDGATYTLTFTIETVQYDKYMSAWSTDVAIAEEKINGLSASDMILTAINDEYNEENKSNLFALTHNDVTDYRFIGNSPNNYVYFNCTDDNDYETCEVWRIIGIFDVDDGKGNFEKRFKIVREKNLDEKRGWDDNNQYEKTEWNESILKSYLNGEYFNNLSDSAKLQIGDAKFYLGRLTVESENFVSKSTEEIYFLERQNEMNDETISFEWVGKISLMYPSDVYMTFANGIDNVCYNNPNDCYEKDKMPWGEYVERENPGYPTKSWIYNTNLIGIEHPDGSWLLSPIFNKKYGTTFYDSVSLLYREGNLSYSTAGLFLGVRPSVYLKSDVKIINGDGSIDSPYVLSKSNDNKKIISYIIGNTISYKNSDYCVIKNSEAHEDYVTLIKQEPLTYDELVSNNNGYEIGRGSVDNSIGVMSYYKNDSCYNNSSSDYNYSGCNNDYNNSNIKNVVNNWSNSFSNDLKEINGYKARLITNNELNSMGHEVNRNWIGGTESVYNLNKSQYDCLYSYEDYWTMDSLFSSSRSYIDIVSNVSGDPSRGIYLKYAVKPVINLKKCALEGTC